MPENPVGKEADAWDMGGKVVKRMQKRGSTENVYSSPKGQNWVSMPIDEAWKKVSQMRDTHYFAFCPADYIM